MVQGGGMAEIGVMSYECKVTSYECKVMSGEKGGVSRDQRRVRKLT